MIAYTIISILLTIAAIVLATKGILWGAILCGIIASVLMVYNYIILQRSKSNVVTVLKAVKNNDHSFYLKDDNMGINQTLNQIKSLIQATQKEIRDQELFLSIIIDKVPTGIIITTPGGTVRFINRAALSYLGLPVVTHLHRIRQVYPELYATLDSMGNSESKGVSIQTEKEVQELTVERTTADLASGTAHIITLNDINSQLDQRETDSWMSLIRVMTHEIMNSIAPIRSISEVLLEEIQDEVTHQAIQTIHDTSDNLIRFVEDYRKFSAVPQPQPTPIEVRKLLEQATTLISSELQSRNVTLQIRINNEVETINADRNLLMQVIQNLLKNALQATPEGGEITLTTDVNSANRALLKIYNSGEAIPEDIRQYIFIPFFTTKEGGSGIGLSLSRYIMRLHGGNLRYLPQPGGSAFILEF